MSEPVPEAADRSDELRHLATATVSRARGVITGLAGVLTAVLGVVFLLVPSWKPLSRDKIDASISVADIENGVSVVRWAHLQFPARADEMLERFFGGPPTRTERRYVGSVVYVRLQTEGFKHRSVRLRASLYDAATRRPGIATSRIAFPASGKLDIDAPSRSSVQLIFVEDLPSIRFHCSFFRVEAYDGSGILAYADSRPFLAGRFVSAKARCLSPARG